MVKLAAFFQKLTPFLKELIHSGGGGFFVKNGRPVPRSDYGSEVAGHYDHVHGAATLEALRNARIMGFDSGGYLPPGISTVLNATRKPEPVFTSQQFAAMGSQQRGGGMTIRAVVEDGAVQGLVRLEIDDQFGALADAKIYGSR